jgi:RNA polymerase sigma factor (sigma-70 family)
MWSTRGSPVLRPLDRPSLPAGAERVSSPSPSSLRRPGVTGPTQPLLPRELSRLLDARTSARADAAWDDFVAVQSRLLLHVVRALTSDHDAAMDAYARVLERLREDDFRRLRAYVPDGRSRFTTWLVAVVRRLCLDWHRERFGRARAEGSAQAREAHERRRQLTALALHVDIEELTDAVDARTPEADGPDEQLRTLELRNALDAALATLSPSDQVLLRLRFDDERSAQQIARALHYPTPFHVYRRINVLLAQLRATLRARGIESSVP